MNGLAHGASTTLEPSANVGRMLVLAVLWLFSVPLSALAAQTLTVTEAPTSAPDTLVTAAQLTAGTTHTYRKAFTLAVTGCTDVATTTRCVVYASATPKSPTPALSNLRIAAAADCATGVVAVTSGATPASSGTTGQIFSMSESATAASQTSTVTRWFCYDLTPTWTSAPQEYFYLQYFRIVRQ